MLCYLSRVLLNGWLSVTTFIVYYLVFLWWLRVILLLIIFVYRLLLIRISLFFRCCIRVLFFLLFGCWVWSSCVFIWIVLGWCWIAALNFFIFIALISICISSPLIGILISRCFINNIRCEFIYLMFQSICIDPQSKLLIRSIAWDDKEHEKSKSHVSYSLSLIYSLHILVIILGIELLKAS